MEMCSYNHEEIIHNERNCPLCLANEAIKQMNDQIESLIDQNDTWQEIISDMENEK